MRKQVFLTSLAITAGLFLSACASTADVDALRDEIRSLEREISSLEDDADDMEECLDDIVDLIEGSRMNEWGMFSCRGFGWGR